MSDPRREALAVIEAANDWTGAGGSEPDASSLALAEAILDARTHITAIRHLLVAERSAAMAERERLRQRAEDQVHYAMDHTDPFDVCEAATCQAFRWLLQDPAS